MHTFAPASLTWLRLHLPDAMTSFCCTCSEVWVQHFSAFPNINPKRILSLNLMHWRNCVLPWIIFLEQQLGVRFLIVCGFLVGGRLQSPQTRTPCSVMLTRLQDCRKSVGMHLAHCIFFTGAAVEVYGGPECVAKESTSRRDEKLHVERQSPLPGCGVTFYIV